MSRSITWNSGTCAGPPCPSSSLFDRGAGEKSQRRGRGRERERARARARYEGVSPLQFFNRPRYRALARPRSLMVGAGEKSQRRERERERARHED